MIWVSLNRLFLIKISSGLVAEKIQPYNPFSWRGNYHVAMEFSRLGKPTDNAFIESFNGKLRTECLNAHCFMCLADATEQCEAWRRDYNEVRPHSAIGNIPPVTLIERSAAHGPRRPQQAGKSSSD